MIWDNPLYHQVNADAVKALKASNIEVELESSQFRTSPATQQMLLAAARTIQAARNLLTRASVIPLFSRFRSVISPLKQIADHINYFNSKAVSGKTLSLCAYHDKVTLIVKKDGGTVIAYCGGIDYNHNRLDNSMHDVQCRVVGPAAQSILSKFIFKWNEYPRTGKSVLKPIAPPVQKPASTPAVYALAVGTENYSKPAPGFDFRRSFADAYLKIIDNAEKYIYIEDQYLVNTEVAERINKRLKATPKLLAILMFQNDKITSADLLIGARKRTELIAKLTAGLSSAQRSNVHLYTLDNSSAKGVAEILHSKILIVDDEIAIIGSGNVNRRSFSHDSETSLVVFDDHSTTAKFAKRLRVALWTKYVLGAFPKDVLEDWATMFKAVTMLPLLPSVPNVLGPLVKSYAPDTSFDKDVIVKRFLDLRQAYASLPGANNVLGALSQLTPSLMDNVFENLADPKG